MKNFTLRSLICILTVFTFSPINAQSNIRVNEKSPEIHITDWIANAPVDKGLEGKYIVLEFWATWCGPCIAAVPHMNELQEEFKRDDLYFVSITDESVEKVERSLKRIDFRSIVVTDLTKKTQINFGDGVNGLEVYPLTVLIDPSGVIKWIGKPMELNAGVMKTFLSGAAVSGESVATATASNVADELNTFDFMELLKNKEITYYFNLKESEGESAGKKAMGNALIQMNGYTLEGIYADIFKVNSTRLNVPKAYREKRMDLIYKNIEDMDDIGRLETDLMDKLGLEKEVSIRSDEVYMVTVKDASLLDEALEEGFSAKSDADDKTIFTGYTIKAMLDVLSEMAGAPFTTAIGEDSKYDFIIENATPEVMINSLMTYGMDVELKNIDVEVITLMEK